MVWAESRRQLDFVQQCAADTGYRDSTKQQYAVRDQMVELDGAVDADKLHDAAR